MQKKVNLGWPEPSDYKPLEADMKQKVVVIEESLRR